MSIKNSSAWLIIPQTNLHVGNESVVSFGVIDKAIQRDAATGIPCINSSSLKGAIKEHLTYVNGTHVDIKSVFGSTKSAKDQTQKGSAVFFDANLLFIPMQCNDRGQTTPYKLVYNEQIVQDFVDKANLLGVKCQAGDIMKKLDANLLVNDNNNTKENKFSSLHSDEALPIIARNCLENGESANLWYEQVLPSRSVLATIIQTRESSSLDCLDGKIIQIGANATIGYGYCKFIKL